MLVLDPVVIISVLTSLFSQGVSGPVLAMPFALIVVEKGILIIFASQNLILEILVVEAVDKNFYWNRGQHASNWQPKQQGN